VKWLFLNTKRRLQHAFSALCVHHVAPRGNLGRREIPCHCDLQQSLAYSQIPRRTGTCARIHATPIRFGRKVAHGSFSKRRSVCKEGPDTICHHSSHAPRYGGGDGYRKWRIFCICIAVEIGDTSYLPADSQPGWIVPTWLRAPWKVHFGDATALLPELLRTLFAIDIFNSRQLAYRGTNDVRI
jgi:hypothetical protein